MFGIKNILNNSKIKLELNFHVMKFSIENTIKFAESNIGKNDNDIIVLNKELSKGENADKKVIDKHFANIREKYIDKTNDIVIKLSNDLNNDKNYNSDEWKNILTTIHHKITKNQYLNTGMSGKIDNKIETLNEVKKEIFVNKDLSDKNLEKLFKTFGFLGASEILFILDNKKYPIISYNMLLDYLSLETNNKISLYKKDLEYCEKLKSDDIVLSYKKSTDILSLIKDEYGVKTYLELNFDIWNRYQLLKGNN